MSDLRLSAADSRAGALRTLRHALAAAGIEQPGREARLLLVHALGLTPEALAADPAAAIGAGCARLEAFARRRIAREPLARLVGEKEFHGLPFQLSPETLVPRPETETLVDLVLAALPADRPCRLLDIGTGSGAILLAVLERRPLACGVGTDLSPGALRTARLNAERLGLAGRARFVACDLAGALTGRFDAVVSNPPYVTQAELDLLEPEVRHHEPRLALDGGADGLDTFRRLARALPDLLAPCAIAAVEIGATQGTAVRAMLAAEGLAECVVHPDLAGRDRVVTARARRG